MAVRRAAHRDKRGGGFAQFVFGTCNKSPRWRRGGRLRVSRSAGLNLSLLSWRRFHAKIHQKHNLAVAVGGLLLLWEIPRSEQPWDSIAAALVTDCATGRNFSLPISPSLLPDPVTGLPRRLLPPHPERKNHKPVEPRLMFCLKITFGGPWPVPKTSALSGRNFSSALAAAKSLFVPPDTWQELFERVPPPPRGKNTQWEPQAARNKPTDERGM